MGFAGSGRRAGRRWSALRFGAASVALCMTLVACGGDDGPSATTDGSEPSASSNGGDDERGTAADVFDEMNALSGDERREALIAGAEEEGELTLYSAGSGWDPVIDAFEDEFGIDVNSYIGQADTVLQRVYQEFEAGFYGVDVYDDAEAYIVARDGLTYEYNNPELTDGLVGYEEGSHVSPTRLSVYTQGWNLDLIDESEIPDTIEGFADPSWSGRLGLDPRDWQWYIGVSNFYIDEHGWTQEEVDEMVGAIAANSSYHPGHTVQAQLLLAGEFPVSMSVYTQSIDRQLRDDSDGPTRWRKESGQPLEPVIYTPQGVALMKNAPNPHAAMLWVDWILEEGAQLLSELDGTPSGTFYAGGPLDGIPEEDLHLVTTEEIMEKQDEWSARYDQLLQAN